jgi:3-hydroxyacyl-[acyl-carrier-protein] dehydratase
MQILGARYGPASQFGSARSASDGAGSALCTDVFTRKKAGMKLDIHDILKKLPHRYPFLLVDRVLKLEKGKRIEALKNVTINEGFFEGHCPRRPVMPGVLMLEALAQASGLLAILSFAEIADDQVMYYFGGIDGARFKRPVEPGDQLRMEVKLLRRKADVFKFKAWGFVDKQIAVEAELLCLRSPVA